MRFVVDLAKSDDSWRFKVVLVCEGGRILGAEMVFPILVYCSSNRRNLPEMEKPLTENRSTSSRFCHLRLSSPSLL